MRALNIIKARVALESGHFDSNAKTLKVAGIEFHANKFSKSYERNIKKEIQSGLRVPTGAWKAWSANIADSELALIRENAPNNSGENTWFIMDTKFPGSYSVIFEDDAPVMALLEDKVAKKIRLMKRSHDRRSRIESGDVHPILLNLSYTSKADHRDAEPNLRIEADIANIGEFNTALQQLVRDHRDMRYL